MARRSDNTRDEVRKMAIKSGQKIISEHGFRGLSAREVARQIGYTIGTIYNIFIDHDTFLLHINAVTLGDMEEFLQNELAEKSAGKNGVKILAKSYKKFAENNYNRWSALFEYSFPAEKEIPAWYSQKIADLLALVEGQLSEILDNKEDIKKSAKVLWAGIHGICILGMTRRLELTGKIFIDDLIDDFLDNYLSGAEA